MSGQADWARRLMDEAVALRAPFGLERSCKIAPGRCNADRFLVSVDAAHLGPNGGMALARLAARLDMPNHLLEEARALLPRASLFHLGFEGEDEGPRLKLYLEFPLADAAEPEASGSDEASKPVFTAWKWRPGDEGGVVSHYRPLPFAGADDLAAEIAAQCGSEAQVMAACVLRLTDRALARAPEGSLQLLAVEEPGTVRRSFDLNLYPAGLTLGAALPQLRALAGAVGAPAGVVEDIAAAHAGAVLGHVAGGTARDGKAFATFYFGAEGR